METIIVILKLILNIVYFIYFTEVIKRHSRSYSDYYYNRILKINSLVFIVNIIIGLLGYGYYTYPFAKIGIKGFFYAGNEVSVLFYCLYYYFLAVIPRGTKKIIPCVCDSVCDFLVDCY